MKYDQGLTTSQVARVYTGPEVSGSRPVLVTFETFKDREEVILNSSLILLQVLRKGNLLKGSNIHISEDISKRVRESRCIPGFIITKSQILCACSGPS